MNLTATRRLAPFMRGEHSLGTAAAELDVPASSLAYWVGRFVRAGLVEITRLQPRAGKPIPIYRAVAREFHIPLDAVPPGAREEFLHGGRRHVFEQFTRAVDRAARHYFERSLRVRSHPVRGVEIGFAEQDDDDAVPMTEWWGSVTLTDAEAKEVQAIFDDLNTRFAIDRDEPGRRRRRYMMLYGLSPDHRPR